VADAPREPRSFEEPRHLDLEEAIGRQVRTLRQRRSLTVAELAASAGLSPGMLSKIENGLTSPSLNTLKGLSEALNVPVTALFSKFEEQREANYVPKGRGLKVDRRGTRSGHQYQLLGHSRDKAFAAEPYLITLTQDSERFPYFQHAGTEFIYMLRGRMGYRHGDRVYALMPGDSLYFDADVSHGPETLDELPIEFLSVIVYTHGDD